MTLVEDWQKILQKAWSVKFSILSALLGGAEVAVQLIQPEGVSSGLFAGMAAMVSMMAVGARILAQQEISSDQSK